jgi:hypothetical protein
LQCYTWNSRGRLFDEDVVGVLLSVLGLSFVVVPIRQRENPGLKIGDTRIGEKLTQL